MYNPRQQAHIVKGRPDTWEKKKFGGRSKGATEPRLFSLSTQEDFGRGGNMGVNSGRGGKGSKSDQAEESLRGKRLYLVRCG